MWTFLGCLLAISSGYASGTVFSVQDDVFAYPQFDVVFSDSYISEAEATRRLVNLGKLSAQLSDQNQPFGELSDYIASHSPEDYDQSKGNDEKDEDEDYEQLLLAGRPYLCSLPRIDGEPGEEKNDSASKVDQETDLVSAAERGWALLRDLEGKCMIYVEGWWSYSFCYNSQITQFHRLAPRDGGSMYPPQEDPSTPSYVLGKFTDKKTDQGREGIARSATAELQVKGKTRYLVQKLSGGTTCDLTGKDRRVEVQFHCHPQSNARIGWVKEVATCTYLMIIYHPRLCNDVAFMPPRHDDAHTIACREILKPDQVASWETRKSSEAERQLIGEGREAPLIVGDIEIGAMRDVGRNGRRIEKGRVVIPPEDRVEIIAVQRGGEVKKLSKEQLRKLDLDPEEAESFRKKIQALAGEKDWRIEKIVNARGVAQLRGVVAGENEDDDEGSTESNGNDSGQGSEEMYDIEH